MFLALLTMVTALAISAVAIYYSVAGLTAIFAAAVIPIIIMGGVLEIAKLVTAVWLHKYWDRAVWWLKGYLSVAVVVLMFITSMGIFGFLSKAHIEQTSLSIEQVAISNTLEEKITRSESKITRWSEEIDRLLRGEDVRVDSLIEREQSEIDKLYERQEQEKQSARNDANSKIELQNNRLAQAQTRKEQDIATAQERYQGTFGDKDALDSAIDRATQNELSVASAVQRQIVNINNELNSVLEEITERYSPQIDIFQVRINDLRNQSDMKTDDIDARLAELEELIEVEQTELDKNREEKNVVQREYRKLEAEVGPVKYIAEFVYGENADQDLLEEAVRWVIIIIIFVFDPLAVLLLIASQYTFRFRNEENGTIISNTIGQSDPVPTPPDNSSTGEASSEGDSEDTAEDRGTTDNNIHLQQEWESRDDNGSKSIDQPSSVDDAAMAIAESYSQKKTEHDLSISDKYPVQAESKKKEYLSYSEPSTEEERKEAYELADNTASWTDAKSAWKKDHPNETLKEHKKKYIRGKIENLPWEEYVQNSEQTKTSLWQQLKDAQNNTDNTT